MEAVWFQVRHFCSSSPIQIDLRQLIDPSHSCGIEQCCCLEALHKLDDFWGFIEASCSKFAEDHLSIDEEFV